VAGGRWSTIGAALATVAALLAASFLTLGGGVWHAFADSMTFTQTVVLEQGGTGWEKIQIAFFARHGFVSGFRSFEISLLAAAWIAPLLSRGVAGIAGIPLGLLLLLAMYVFTLRRAVLDRQGFAAAIPGIAQA
jgi:hypothetical protein